MTTFDALLLLLIFATLRLPVLLTPPLWHHVEVWEGLVIEGISETHQWILPFRFGDLPSKPPLFNWIAALAALVFGRSDTTVVVPSAIGVEVMAIATFLVGKLIGGQAFHLPSSSLPGYCAPCRASD